MEPGAANNVQALRSILRDLDDKTGELAEVRKAENIAYTDNLTGNTITEARENAKRAAAAFYREAIDLECDVESLLRWRDFYTLLIRSDVAG